jgi:hypothetical protein
VARPDYHFEFTPEELRRWTALNNKIKEHMDEVAKIRKVRRAMMQRANARATYRKEKLRGQE